MVGADERTRHEQLPPVHGDRDDERGDRVQHLVFTGPDLDAGRLRALLDSCLLGEGEDAGREDPFAAILDHTGIA
ncbi:GTP-binding protein [Nonomuraea rosea]|uniref:GTP-binding protein n=1 Tax=Nonomuraea rosea TaxID=638574 RepID=UPI003CD095EA